MKKTIVTKESFPTNLNVFLFLFCIISTVFLLNNLKNLVVFGYLGSPFFYDANDTFMDYFNTYYWSFNPGPYTEWKSIYHPISFLYFKIIESEHCVNTVTDSLLLRDCHIYSIIYLIFASLFASFLTALYLRKQIVELKNSTSILLFFTVFLSWPMLFAIERGNLILLAFCFFLIYMLCSNGFCGKVTIAVAVLLKPYLIIIYSAIFLKKSLLCFVSSVFFLILIGYFTYAIYGDDDALLIIDNIIEFSDALEFSFFEKLQYTTSLKMWDLLFNSNRSAYPTMLGSYEDFVGVLVSLLRNLVLVFIASFVAYVFYNKSCFELYFIILVLILSLLIISDAAGGYGLLFLIPVALNYSIARKNFLFLSALLLLILPVDPFYLYSQDFIVHSFVNDLDIVSVKGVTIGSILRPLILIFMAIILFMNAINLKRSCMQ